MLELKAKSGNVRLYDMSLNISYFRWTKVDENKALKSYDLVKNINNLLIRTDNAKIKQFLKTKSSKTVTATKTNNVVIQEQNKIYVAHTKDEIEEKEQFVYKPEHDVIWTGEDITANNIINEVKEEIQANKVEAKEKEELKKPSKVEAKPTKMAETKQSETKQVETKQVETKTKASKEEKSKVEAKPVENKTAKVKTETPKENIKYNKDGSIKKKPGRKPKTTVTETTITETKTVDDDVNALSGILNSIK